jgi:hypothetical protein
MFFLMHIAALSVIAVITGNYAYLSQNHVAIQPLMITIVLANILNRLTIMQLREDKRDGEGETLSCIFYAVTPALFYNVLVYVFYRSESIWIKMFFLWFVGFGFFGKIALTSEKRDDCLTQNFLEILLYFFLLIAFAIVFQYVALRVFQKDSLGEAWSLSISSLGPPVLFYLIVNSMKG